jgi:hypothetical protein
MGPAALALTWILTAAASPAQPIVQTSETRNTTRLWPCRLVVQPPLLNVVQDAWQRSPTLQGQCRKLADARAVVQFEWGKAETYARAATRIGRDSKGVIVAMVSVPPVSGVIELVAHEIEHVLEWVEGRDLPGEARRGGSGVWEAFGGFETQRAIDIGRQAAREVEESRHAR